MAVGRGNPIGQVHKPSLATLLMDKISDSWIDLHKIEAVVRRIIIVQDHHLEVRDQEEEEVEGGNGIQVLLVPKYLYDWI